MTENLTKAKELYQDIATALSNVGANDHSPDHVRKEVLKLAFELYLLVEHGEKLCVERGKIKDRPDEQIGTIVDRAFEKLKQNEEKREALRIEHEENRRRTVGVFNKTVEI